MSIRFNADEVFQIAERREKDAAAFYRAAAEKVSVPAAQQLLKELSEWEGKHEKLLAALRKDLSPKDRESTAYDPEGEASLYLKALADDSIAQSACALLEDLGPEPSFAKILRIGIEKEKEAINFYVGMKELVPPTLGQEKIDRIIREEMKHVTMLTNQLNKAAGCGCGCRKSYHQGA